LKKASRIEKLHIVKAVLWHSFVVFVLPLVGIVLKLEVILGLWRHRFGQYDELRGAGGRSCDQLKLNDGTEVIMKNRRIVVKS
jgi:hypothetical protein